MRRYPVRIILTIVLLAGAVPGRAFTRGHTVRGHVTGVEGDPVEGAIVQIRNQNEELLRGEDITDEQGYYEIWGVPSGTWKVVAYEPGHSKTIYQLRLMGPNGSAMQDIQMVDHARDPQAFGLYLPPGQRVKNRAVRLWLKAHKALGKKDFDLAVKRLERAIKVDPTFSRAHTELGIEYQRRGVQAMADFYYRRGLELNPGDPIPMINLAGLRISQRRAGEAVILLTRALEIDPLLPKAHLLLGRIRVAQGRYAESLDPLRESARLDPAGCSEAHRLLGTSYIELDRRQEARSALRRYLEHHPDSPQAPRTRATLAELEEILNLERRNIEPSPWSGSRIQ